MSKRLSEADMNRVLTLIAEYETQGINLDFDFAVKHVNDPDGIRRALIAEKPVIDNTQEKLTEKYNQQANRVFKMLPNNSGDKDFKAKVLRIVSQNNGTDEELANICFVQLILDKSSVATAKPAKNNCIATEPSYTDNSGWKCTNCTYQNFQNDNECGVCGESKESSTEFNNNNSMSTNDLFSASAFNTQNSVSIEDMSWICRTCTYENPKNVEECEICDEPKILEEEEYEQQLTDTEMQLLNATNLGTRLRELGVDIDSIEDLIPFVIQRKNSSLEEMVDIYISTHSNVEMSTEPVRNAICSNKNVEWKCTTCTFFNKENDVVCISCETNRENEVWTCICTTENSIIRNTCIVCENVKDH
jgi:hypothetical protein